MKLNHIILSVIGFSLLAFSCKPSEAETPINKLIELRNILESRITNLEDSVSLVEAKIELLDTTEKDFPRVLLDSVRNNSISEDVTFQGSVEADKTIMLGPETQGVIKNIYVKEGQYLSRGKTIAVLDSEIIRQNVKEVEKTLELAEYMLVKQKNLKDQGMGAEANYVQAKNQVESLKTKLSTLKTQASKSNVTAPFSGYVDEIFTKLGEMASPSMPIIRLVNLDKVVVKAEVSEAYLMDIKAGDKVSLNFPSIGKVIENAQISSIGKFINPTNRTFPIQVEIRNSDKSIIPNLLAEVTVEKDFTEEAIIISSSSVLTDSEGEKYAYIFERGFGKNGVAKKRKVNVIYVKGEFTQIDKSSEVKVGDIIISKGANGISDEQEVTEL
ncbi:efflux RND transporter periplasmic adaptor subunit [Flavobacteriales bacterium]|nr:efflux RND transporter periplasmic adaptor subunit [Flavobacteriales bacterium]